MKKFYGRKGMENIYNEFIKEIEETGMLRLIHIYNVIDYCSQTQAVYDHLWNCSYPINELLHSFLDLFTGVKKYVVYY